MISSDENHSYSVLQPARQAFLEDLQRGRFHPGERLPGERELAKLYGIGRSSMVKVLKQLEKERYVERVPVYGTYVRQDVANRVEPLTLTVASVDMPEQDGINSPFSWEVTSEILRGLISESSKHKGIHLNWYCCPDTSNETELLRQIEDLMESDGIIFNGCGMDLLKFELFRRKKPALTLGPKLDYCREVFPVIDYDRWGIFPDYPMQLAKMYPDRPVFLLSRDPAECDMEELHQYKRLFNDGFKQCGIEVMSIHLPSESQDYGELKEVLKEHLPLLQLEKSPLLVSLNRALLPPLCILLREKSLTVPLAGLVGGNTIESLHSEIPHWQEPFFEMGSSAVRMLVEQLRESKTMKDLILPMHFHNK